MPHRYYTLRLRWDRLSAITIRAAGPASALVSKAVPLAALLVSSMKVPAMAGGTIRRSSRPVGNLPSMAAVAAMKSSHIGHNKITSFNSESLPFHQRLRYFAVCRIDDPPKGGARYLHSLGCLFLVQAVQIRKPQGFELIHRHRDLLELRKRDSTRFEIAGRRLLAYPAATWRSGHRKGLSSHFHYEHMLTTKSSSIL
jgi:hypothetical protein